MKIVELTGTANGSGAATLTNSQRVNGYVEKIVMDYVDGDTGADLVLTCEDVVSENILTKANLGTSDAVFYPRTLGNSSADGAAFTDVGFKIFASGTFKAVIASGGDTTTFRFLIYLSDE